MSLSPREIEIVEAAAQGLPDKAIADSLGCSPHTVNTHWRRVFKKFGVRSRGQAIALSLKAVTCAEK